MNLLTIMVKEGSKVPTKRHLSRRGLEPDPIYNDIVITKLINNVMQDGKKRI